jgi:beta-glucuronidase
MHVLWRTRALLTPRRTLLALLAIGAALASTIAAAQAPSSSPRAWPSQTAVEGSSQPLIFEGPGGRTRLSAWTLRKDPADRGMTLGWQRGAFAGSPVSVPSVVSAGPYKGRAGVPVYEGSVAWYRTSFQAPSAGLYALSFQSASFQATVWVDGHALAAHSGPYLPFEARAQLVAGAHTVVVRVDWRDPGRQAREGFHRTWFNWGGLDGEVDVRPVGESELSDPSIQTTISFDGASPQATVRLGVEVHNYGPSRTILPAGTLLHGAQSIPVSFAALSLAHGQTAVARASVTVPEAAVWSPASPSLYELTLAVAGESSYSARVGLRQLGRQAGRLYLNGRQLRLHGASVQEDAVGHGDALSPSDEDTIVAELKRIGANAVRSQHPLDPALLERLDAAGILVWQGVGPVEGAANWYSSTSRLLSAAEQQARTAALAAELHPSIFAWNVVNEVAGNGRDAAEVRYVQDTARWLHAHDPTRMVAVDVWGDHPPQHAGPLYSGADAVAETDYTGWYDNPHASEAQQRAQMRARLAAMARTFPGKVLVISEFGAESNTLNSPGSAGSYAYQSRLLAQHIAVYAADPQLSGMLVWLLRDYPLNPSFEGGVIHGVLPRLRLIEGLNQKGLFTYGGQAKPAAAVVAHAFSALPAG